MEVGRLLRVNLSAGTTKEEEIPQQAVKQFVGGRGMAAQYLYQECIPGIDPLAPENNVIFSVGPLAGTGALACSRWMVTTKSPLTATYYRSVGGADFGAWMAHAGLDLLIIEGRAASPSYLYIADGKYELHDASDLWGKTTSETQQLLKQKHGERVRCACIGPAGEKLVRYAVVMSDRRCAGRGGTGAVLGAKNLKAVVISASRREEKARDKGQLKELINQEVVAFRASPLFNPFSEAGTIMMTEAINAMGLYPTKNFREGSVPGWERIALGEYAKLKEKNTSCYGCVIHCGNVHTVREGPYAGVSSEGPDYETVWAFTAPAGCTSVEATIVADAYCDDMGLDTISAGNCIGFAFELYEKGLLSESDTGGLRLTYGDHQAMLELLKQIPLRQGLGDILAEGVVRAAARIGRGAEEYAVAIKGLEPPAYDPRGAKAHGLSMATSNVGANHCIGYAVQEIFNLAVPRPVNRFADSGNADIVKLNQDSTAFYETGIACIFPALMGMMPPLLFGKLLASVTGIDELAAPGYLFTVGERIYNLERAFNVREGFERDSFATRLTESPLTNAGPAEGQFIRQPKAMIDEYCRVRGWDGNGCPTREKLEQLGLSGLVSL
ncbi:MAG: ABC transporter ATP-binding protein [Clostridia bacterium]|nr:MAG: ABC transporter ATP-binding protein [Clostridia bacterium]